MKSNWVSKLLAVSILGILVYIPLATGNVASQENGAMGNPPPNPNNQFSGDTTKGMRMPKNVQVLTGLNLQQIGQKMVDVSKGLGVKCIFCHVPRDYPNDQKDEKRTARKMLKMVKDLNTNYFGEEKAPKITCYTCHRGQEKPVSIPAPAPQQDNRPPLRPEN